MGFFFLCGFRTFMMPLSISEVKFTDVIKYGTQHTMVNHNQPSCHIPEFNQVQPRPRTTLVHLGTLGLLGSPSVS